MVKKLTAEEKSELRVLEYDLKQLQNQNRLIKELLEDVRDDYKYAEPSFETEDEPMKEDWRILKSHLSKAYKKLKSIQKRTLKRTDKVIEKIKKIDPDILKRHSR